MAEQGVLLAIRTGVNTGSWSPARPGPAAPSPPETRSTRRRAWSRPQATARSSWAARRTPWSATRWRPRQSTPCSPRARPSRCRPTGCSGCSTPTAVGAGARTPPWSGVAARAAFSTTRFERTLASGHSHLVTVIGPPGIGKSRLASRVPHPCRRPRRVARGRCLSYGQGITYWPLVQALRDALDLSGTESAEITRHALAAGAGRGHDRDEVVDLLLALLGKAGAPVGSEQTFWSRTPAGRGARLPASARPEHRRPALGRADPAGAARAGARRAHRPAAAAAVPGTARAAGAAPRLGLRGRRLAMILGLDPLSAAETECLRGRAARRRSAGGPGRHGGRLVRAATRCSSRRSSRTSWSPECWSATRTAAGGWHVRSTGPQLPPTVTALLTSRLDRLPAGRTRPAGAGVGDRAGVHRQPRPSCWSSLRPGQSSPDLLDVPDPAGPGPPSALTRRRLLGLQARPGAGRGVRRDGEVVALGAAPGVRGRPGRRRRRRETSRPASSRITWSRQRATAVS